MQLSPEPTPQSPLEGIRAGSTVTLTGISARPELNGRVAVVLSRQHSRQAAAGYDKGRVPVMLKGGGGSLLVRPESVAASTRADKMYGCAAELSHTLATRASSAITAWKMAVEARGSAWKKALLSSEERMWAIVGLAWLLPVLIIIGLAWRYDYSEPMQGEEQQVGYDALASTPAPAPAVTLRALVGRIRNGARLPPMQARWNATSASVAAAALSLPVRVNGAAAAVAAAAARAAKALAGWPRRLRPLACRTAAFGRTAGRLAVASVALPPRALRSATAAISGAISRAISSAATETVQTARTAWEAELVDCGCS